MRGAVTIWKKEALIYATSARWYVISAVLVSFLSLGFFLMNLQEGRQATFAGVAGWLSFIMIFATPVFTMRLIADEANRGTLELLLTSPVKDWEIVLGKFLGALTAYVVLFGVTLIYPAILFRFAEPDIGPMFTQYLGLVGVSMAFISVGMFASSVTDSQVLAAVLAFILNLFLWIAHVITPILPEGLSELGVALSVYSHLDKFNRGLIDAVDVFYYFAFTAIFLLLSLRFVEARRWAA